MNTSVVLPYNWWTETQPTTSCQISGLTLEQGTKNNINIGPSNGFQFNLTLKDCDINGAMYFYWNNDFNFTVDGCHFQNTENSKSQSYALLIQGNDNGTYEPHVTFTNSTVEGFQRGINLDCQNTAFVVTDNTFKSTTYFLKNKSALQITRGKSFFVSGNTFESGVTGYAIELYDLLASSTVEIRNNIFDSAKGIKNSITEANRETVTVIEENNSGSAVNP